MLEKIIASEIIIVEKLGKEEADDLVAKKEVADLATSRFISGQLSFSDFLECMEIAGVNIDEYLICANSNAKIIGF
jgi:hypothetical protein